MSRPFLLVEGSASRREESARRLDGGCLASNVFNFVTKVVSGNLVFFLVKSFYREEGFNNFIMLNAKIFKMLVEVFMKLIVV